MGPGCDGGAGPASGVEPCLVAQWSLCPCCRKSELSKMALEDRRGAERSVFGPLGPWFLQKHRWEPFDVLIFFNAIKLELAIPLI